MHVNRYVATAIVAVALMSGSTAANAAAPSAEPTIPAGVQITPQIQAYLDTLSPAQRTNFINTELPATVTQTVTNREPADATARLTVLLARATGQQIAPMASGCWTGRINGWDKAPLGNTLFTYYHVGGWCISGSTVTSSNVTDAGGETSTPGWSYDGVINRAAGVVSNEGRSYSQTKFTLGSGGWNIQTVTPCLRAHGLNNATYTWDTTCGIY